MTQETEGRYRGRGGIGEDNCKCRRKQLLFSLSGNSGNVSGSNTSAGIMLRRLPLLERL